MIEHVYNMVVSCAFDPLCKLFQIGMSGLSSAVPPGLKKNQQLIMHNQVKFCGCVLKTIVG